MLFFSILDSKSNLTGHLTKSLVHSMVGCIHPAFRNTAIFHVFCYSRKLSDILGESEKRLLLISQLYLKKAGEET